MPNMDEFEKQVKLVRKVAPDDRDDVQAATMDQSGRFSMIAGVSSVGSLYVLPPLRPGEQWRPLAQTYTESKADGAGPEPESLRRFLGLLQAYAEDRPVDFNRGV